MDSSYFQICTKAIYLHAYNPKFSQKGYKFLILKILELILIRRKIINISFQFFILSNK